MTQKDSLFERLVIFEMANNHMGDLEHGLRIVREFHQAVRGFDFRFAFKLQYRDLDTLIHPDPARRAASKYVQRFLGTRLPAAQFQALREEIRRLGFLSICTPFDEASVGLIEEHGFDVLKIGSCSFTDWPLWERVARTDKPIIASTGGAELDDIDKVVAFLTHRQKRFALMHCVGEYPTPAEHLQLDQIDLLKKRYPEVPVGYSTHESPDQSASVALAVAKGACLLEKHVTVRTERYPGNAYSADPAQIRLWLESASSAFRMCGTRSGRMSFSEKEKADLRGLQRGVFAKGPLKKGDRLQSGNIRLALPNQPGQLVANDLSKYITYLAQADLEDGQPVMSASVQSSDQRDRIVSIIDEVRPLLKASGVTVRDKLEMELSHHFGIDRFPEWGATIINVINREYCKKLIVLLPKQKHPAHTHAKKEETFHILFGELSVDIDGERKDFSAGDMVVIERGVKHSFESAKGAVFEEISTTHYQDDSCYEAEEINRNPQRKTHMTFWADWLADTDKIR